MTTASRNALLFIRDVMPKSHLYTGPDKAAEQFGIQSVISIIMAVLNLPLISGFYSMPMFVHNCPCSAAVITHPTTREGNDSMDGWSKDSGRIFFVLWLVPR